MKPSASLPFVAVAAATAVAFWALKPIFISMIGDRAGYAEVFVAAGLISVASSLFCAVLMWRRSFRLLRDRRALYGLAQAAISGGFLALWYYGFYRALYGAAKVDATVIAFTWPLISILAMRLFAPHHGRSLKGSEYALIFVSFAGAVSIGLSGLTSGGGSGEEIIFAFVAAIGSGFYLPFAINAISRFSDILGSKITGTFYVISVANAVALLAVSVQLKLSGSALYFYGFDTQVWLICALIGIGTYLVAEITWTWAFSEYQSLTLSTLPYFSPALSVILLYILFDEPVAPIAAFGLVLVLFSNMTLHGMYKSNNAMIMALIGTIYVALASQIVPPLRSDLAVDLLFAISGLFAILAGFVLSRVSGRRAQELDARSRLVRAVLAQQDSAPADHLDAIFRDLVDLQFTPGVAAQEAQAGVLRRRLAELGASAPMEAFDAWFTIHGDRLSLGEKAALWITGLGSILFLMIVRDDSPIGLIGLYVFAAGCLLMIFSISDYEQNNLHGFRNQIMRLQQGFVELGRPYYLPAALIGSRELSALPAGAVVRHKSEGGLLAEDRVAPRGGAFRVIYWLSAALVAASLVVLPLSARQDADRGLGRVMRPEQIAGRLLDQLRPGVADVTIARLDWDASRVIAEILRAVIVEGHGLNVSIRDARVDEVFPEMASDGGSIDVHPDLWTGNQAENLRRYIEDQAAVRLNIMPYQGVQGVFAPREIVEQLALRGIEDLRRPDVIARFDSDKDGRGEIWLGAQGWKSTDLMAQMLRNSGLDADWEGQVFSDRIFKAKLERDRARGVATLFYGYAPDWIHAVYDLTEITGLAEAGQHTCLDTVPDPLCALSPVAVHVAYAARLEESFPEVAHTLRHVSFRVEDLNTWLAATSHDGDRPEDVAARWLSQNPQRIKEWLGR
ncbi:MAG: hypothetical protein CSA72_04530 [Rhodobacterales bacterium]|nr:MAG: hypothetical protein CSA72_04530 [Rhodobacterales bacterium]